MIRPRPERTLLLVVGVLAALLLLAAGAYVVRKHQWAAARLAELEPRYARFEGLHASRADLEAAAARQAQALQNYAYPAEQDAAQVANAALQRVRDVLGGAGLQVLSSQALAPSDDVSNFQRIPIDVRIEGSLAAIQQALAAFAAQSPAMVVDSVTLRINESLLVPAEQPVSGLLTVSVLKVGA